MMPEPSPPAGPARPFESHMMLMSAALLLGLFATFALPIGRSGPGTAPFPFVWRDVAFVCFAAAIPCSTMLVVWLKRRLPPRVLPPAGLLMLGGLALVWLRAPSTTSITTRSLLALCETLPVLLILSRFIPARDSSPSFTIARKLGLVAMGIVSLAALPQMYVESRCRRDLERLDLLLEESRLGAAQQLAPRILALDPSAMIRDRPLNEIVRRLNDVVLDLQDRLDVPLGSQATNTEKLIRAEQLAIVERSEEAIHILEPLAAAGDADAGNLLGTIYESHEDWTNALRWYSSTRKQIGEPTTPAERDNHRRSLMGIALAQRKLGALTESEQAYRELLRDDPTAETHFLIAQFYEDTQRSELARVHARQAMSLKPERFEARGEQLLNKLVTLHFGCLSVFREERRGNHSPSTTPVTTP